MTKAGTGRAIAVFSLLLMTMGAAAGQSHNQSGPQLYNMSFDTWSKSKGAWNLYPLKTKKSERVWDSANHGLSLLGINGTMPEYEHVAVKGEGKAAAKIVSKKVVWAFVAGNLYTGRFVKIVNFAGAELEFGVPFKGRPTSLCGYYDYRPSKVNFAKSPHEDMKGKMDVGRIEVILTDWSAPYNITTNYERFIDGATDPHVIGRAVIELKKATNGYVYFEVPIEYRDDRTPTYVDITATPSRYGEFFTGGSGSTLYVDEFEFKY